MTVTPSQTIGPFFEPGMTWLVGNDADTGAVPLGGTVFDSAGEPVADAMVELWHADPTGRFPGVFARALTDADGRFRFTVVPPGRVDDVQAPHVDVSVFARGLVERVVTRLYFPDEPSNADDPVLAAVDPDRRGTLVAEREGDSLRFDIHLQGERETVFFAW